MAGEKVLVIEDNAMNMQLTVDLLEVAGFVVIQAQTAEQGIELAKAESPDLILMDISLPGMDGLTATGILKQHPDTKYVPVVALTAHAMRGDEKKAIAAGCTGYITKPINTETFHKTVSHYIKNDTMKKILVVDNDRFILKFMRRLLEKEGHDVRTATSGLDALDILMDHTPEVIFTDLVMPNIDGQMLCKIIRSMHHLKDAYLVILSAIAAEEKTDIIKLGVQACIAKGPLDEMSKNILEVLHQPQLVSSRCRSGEVIGIKNVYPRATTRELLSVKKHFKIILEKMLEGILEVSSSGRIVYANPAALSLAQMSEKNLLGMNFYDLFAGESRHRVKALMKKSTGKPKTIAEDFPVRLNDHQITLNIRPLEGNGASSIIILDDITERKQAREVIQKAYDELEMGIKQRTADLKRANEKLKQEIIERRQTEKDLQQSYNILSAIVEGTTDTLFLKDIQGCYVMINSAGAEAFGKPVDEIIGRNDLELWGPETGGQIVQTDQTVLKFGQTSTFEEMTPGQNGKIFWRTTKGPYLDPEGNVIGLFGISRDITGFKQSEEALFKAKEAAEAASRAKSDFLAAMSHELRTPLNAIVGFSEILADRNFGELNERQLKYTNNILKSGRQLTKLISDILDLAEVETRQAKLDLGEVDILSIIHSVFESFQLPAGDKNIALKIDLEEPLPPITADEDKLKKILAKLLDNAVKFTPKSGSVRLSARIADRRWSIEDSKKKKTIRKEDFNQQYLEISVSDTGIGIKPENQEQIFSTFEQIDSTYARQEGGTGLGLALARRLIEQHGGRILVESDGHGKGSTFTIFLPVKPRASAAKILLVDDDESVLNVFYQTLTMDPDYMVEKASNGTEALIKMGTYQPDLLILDVFMPELDGVDVCRAIKKDPKLSDMEVIIITGFPEDSKLKKISEMGFSKIYNKPLKILEMKHIVDDVLKKRTSE